MNMQKLIKYYILNIDKGFGPLNYLSSKTLFKAKVYIISLLNTRLIKTKISWKCLTRIWILLEELMQNTVQVVIQ